VPAYACYLIGGASTVAFIMAERMAGDEALLPPRLFRNPVFALGSAQSAIIGVGMFGGITLLPLYLQLVKGNSPTKAGLLVLPLVFGIMGFSVIAGQVTSRTGRYKIFPSWAVRCSSSACCCCRGSRPIAAWSTPTWPC